MLQLSPPPSSRGEAAQFTREQEAVVAGDGRQPAHTEDACNEDAGFTLQLEPLLCPCSLPLQNTALSLPSGLPPPTGRPHVHEQVPRQIFGTSGQDGSIFRSSPPSDRSLQSQILWRMGTADSPGLDSAHNHTR